MFAFKRYCMPHVTVTLARCGESASVTWDRPFRSDLTSSTSSGYLRCSRPRDRTNIATSTRPPYLYLSPPQPLPSIANSGHSTPRSHKASHHHNSILAHNKSKAHTLPLVIYAPIILRLSSALGRKVSASDNSLRAALLHVTNLSRQSLSLVSLPRQSSLVRAGSGWARGSLTLSDLLGYHSIVVLP